MVYPAFRVRVGVDDAVSRHEVGSRFQRYRSSVPESSCCCFACAAGKKPSHRFPLAPSVGAEDNAAVVKVYSYSGCSTCRRALGWLRGRSIEHTVIPVRDSPPPLSELMEMLAHYGERRNTVLNTSGRDYREMVLKDRVSKMTDQELAELLSDNGNLIKRPFVYSRERKIVGFREADWEQLFG